MQTFKNIMIWVAIIILVFIGTDFANFYLLASTYKDVETKVENSENISIAIHEAKATYVNGYAKIAITNISNTEINNRYLLLDGYSERENNLTSKFVEINNLAVGETRDIEIAFKAQEVKKVVIYESDKKQDKYVYAYSEIDKPTLLLTAIILLYFLG